MSRQLVINIEVGLSLEGVSAMGVVDELEKLADLFHKEVISEQEFQELKEQLISRDNQRTEDARAGAGLVWTPEQMKKAQAEKQKKAQAEKQVSRSASSSDPGGWPNGPRTAPIRGGIGSRKRPYEPGPIRRGLGGSRRYEPPRNRAFVGAGGARFCPNCTKRVQKAANYCMTCGVLL